MVRHPPRPRRDVRLRSAGAPLIVTAELPRDIHRWATQLRRAFYPPDRNHLDAHVTLFHALPPSLEGEARGELSRFAAANPPAPARLAGLRLLDGGIAVDVHSPAMLRLRDELAKRFHGMLTAQDNHRPRLHITIQNKVGPAAAKASRAALEPMLASLFDRRDFAFAGLSLHAYEGGPWRMLQRWAFRG